MSFACSVCGSSKLHGPHDDESMTGPPRWEHDEMAKVMPAQKISINGGDDQDGRVVEYSEGGLRDWHGEVHAAHPVGETVTVATWIDGGHVSLGQALMVSCECGSDGSATSRFQGNGPFLRFKTEVLAAVLAQFPELDEGVTGMDDPATWLRAQLDEDERVALAARKGASGWDGDGVWTTDDRDSAGQCRIEGDVITIYDEGGHTEAHAKHIALWDPARVLADIDAKRRILAECEYEINDAEKRDTGDGVGLSHTILGLLALPYAGRDGYREEWRP